MTDDDYVTIPELTVPRDELAEWQRVHESNRRLYERYRSYPTASSSRMNARLGLLLLSVDTSPPIRPGDQVRLTPRGASCEVLMRYGVWAWLYFPGTTGPITEHVERLIPVEDGDR